MISFRKASKSRTRGVSRMAAVFGAASLALFALAALAATPPGNASPVLWGVVADAGTVVLLDSGVQTSITMVNPAGADAILCQVQDAGTNAALAQITLLGSNTGALPYIVLGSSVVTPGNSAIVGWDPVNSAVAIYALQVDGGGTVAGSVVCTVNNKGQQP